MQTRHGTASCSITFVIATATAMAGCSSPKRQTNAPAAAIAFAARKRLQNAEVEQQDGGPLE